MLRFQGLVRFPAVFGLFALAAGGVAGAAPRAETA